MQRRRLPYTSSMRRRTALALLLCAGWTCHQPPVRDHTAGGPPVILVSLDGFRWDYDVIVETPNLRRLAARGVRAQALVPSFPSKTFPNHYTIVTGMYPGRHGIVANTLWDPDSGRIATLTRPEHAQDARWWNGPAQPLWVTLERQGSKTAAMFWPGTEARIDGIRPTYWHPFDDTYPADARIEQVLRWVDLPSAERPQLITLYFSDVDSAGHDYGPDSPEVREAVARVDGYLGALMSGLERRGVLETTNVVVTSDHGMAATSPDRVVIVDDYVELRGGEVVDINPTLSIAPQPGREEEIYRALSDAHPRLHVYRRADTPPHWRYRDHPRIPAIIGVVDEGWVVVRRSVLNTVSMAVGGRGQHGYDPAASPSMAGLFVAAGPAFAQGVTVPAFENVHVYNALAAALGITPAPNDGDPAIARTLLREP
jgi:predicted AlkP superfamily pyrophosphatase or phosphodiesterase